MAPQPWQNPSEPSNYEDTASQHTELLEKKIREAIVGVNVSEKV